MTECAWRDEWPAPEPSDLVLPGAEARGEAGRAWRERLPAIVEECARTWSLSVGRPFAGLSYNYVAPVVRGDGSPAVLKLYFPDEQAFRNEAEALRVYAGEGAVRLLALDAGNLAILLERAVPGTDLWELQDERRRLEVLAGVMRRLWRPPPAAHVFPTAREHVRRMASLAPRLAHEDFPLQWLAQAERLFERLEAADRPLLLHEDLHRGNVLAAEREPWLAIDPHGLVGPRAYDAIQLILNELWRQEQAGERRRTLTRYSEFLAGALGLEREAIIAAGVVRAVIKAFWTLEDRGAGWEKDIAIVEDFASML